jgi:hypothetical protein
MAMAEMDVGWQRRCLFRYYVFMKNNELDPKTLCSLVVMLACSRHSPVNAVSKRATNALASTHANKYVTFMAPLIEEPLKQNASVEIGIVARCVRLKHVCRKPQQLIRKTLTATKEMTTSTGQTNVPNLCQKTQRVSLAKP